MPDVDPGQDPNVETPPAGAGAPPAGDPPNGDDPSTWDPDRAMHTIRTLREREKDGQRAARERDALAARVRELEDAQKSDEQRRADELERLRAATKDYAAKERRWMAERAVLEAAPKAGITDIALALAVIRPDDITFDDDGHPENVDDVLAGLVERHPALAGETPKPKPPTTDARKGRTQPDGPKLTAEEMDMARRMGMSPEEYATYKGVDSADKYAAIAAANTKE